MWKTARGKAFSVGVVSGKQGSLFLHHSYKAWMTFNSMEQLLHSTPVLHCLTSLLACAILGKMV